MLQTVPGIGALTAAVVVAEVGDIRRFPTVDDFIGYCGLYPWSKQSGDGTSTSQDGAQGQPHAPAAAVARLDHRAPEQPASQRLLPAPARARGKSAKCAGGAAGRKLATQLFAILKTRSDYDPNRL